jgi:uncharacterized membrane-anchored protein YitT (DUF2179 family)
MGNILKKSAQIALAILGTFSFLYGGIYTEMIQEGLGLTIGNILLAFVGAFLIAGVLVAFIPVFVISLIVYYVKNKKSE